MGKKLLKTYKVDLANAPIEFNWYSLKVNFNYEQAAKKNIINNMIARGYGDYIKDIVVPIVERTVEKTDRKGNTKLVTKNEKIWGLDGYIWVNMILTDVTWNIVRNSSGVMMWLDSEGRPLALTPDEINNIKRICEVSVEEPQLQEVILEIVEYDGPVGAYANIIEGPARGMGGKIISISQDRTSVKLEVDNGMKFDVPAAEIELV